jgi:endoglucanase
VGIAALLQSAEPVGRSPANAVQAGPSEFVKQPDGAYKARLEITKDDAPGLAIIAEEGTGGTLSELVLFLGAAQAEWVALDNIAVTGSRTVVDRPVSHAPLGRPTLPADFANSTRGGWDWDAESGIRTSLEIQYADGHKTISWEAAYPDVKPYDGWASAARLVLGGINAARGGNRYVFMELYLKPVRAGRGHIAVHLAFAPPELNYWAQAAESCNIALERLSQGEKTADGLYLYKIAFDLDKIGGGKKLAPDTVLRDLIVIVADVDCDFIGRMYMSNVRFGHAEAPAIAI